MLLFLPEDKAALLSLFLWGSQSPWFLGVYNNKFTTPRVFSDVISPCWTPSLALKQTPAGALPSAGLIRDQSHGVGQRWTWSFLIHKLSLAFLFIKLVPQVFHCSNQALTDASFDNALTSGKANPLISVCSFFALKIPKKQRSCIPKLRE